ncbi:hypothetical protein [Mangrovimonas sp. DI 80]|uniref:hypothetical protein n=1 Tax=Mangrovimonas sp. DI 80 TaxID=1779330 RepID=UPI0009777147|nr:hypothetical protein [Mangrovimonas sp. DI 80]OMP32576.1 hypothetical protein BKM32_05905 [Mangrovimonas sp. DI 80]
MSASFFTLKEVDLNNNCPECYSKKGLHLTFKQKLVENAFYKAVTKDTSHTLYCHTCNTEIYPVQWTHEIEQVFAYQQRATPAKPRSVKLTKLSWILIALDLLLILAIILYVFGVFEN